MWTVHYVCYMHSLTRGHTQSHRLSDTYYYIVIVAQCDAHTYSRTYIHELTHTRTLSHSHSRTYMHALTHTHTHSRYIDIGNPFPISIVVISMC